MSVLVPEVVRNKALAAGATAWLDELPRLIADLERDWDIAIGPPFPDATEAFVAEASGPGPGAVLKLMIPRPATTPGTRSRCSAQEPVNPGARGNLYRPTLYRLALYRRAL